MTQKQSHISILVTDIVAFHTFLVYGLLGVHSPFHHKFLNPSGYCSNSQLVGPHMYPQPLRLRMSNHLALVVIMSGVAHSVLF